MGIAAKHAYRFVFLRSEEWSVIKSEALLHFQCKCYLCGVEDFSNDLHHVKYAKQWKKSGRGHMLLLCRRCHIGVHQLIKILNLENKPTQWRLIDLIKSRELIPSPLAAEDVPALRVAAEKEQVTRLESDPPKRKTHCIVCKCDEKIHRNVFACFPHLGNKIRFKIPLCEPCCTLTQHHLLGFPGMPASDREAYSRLELVFAQIKQKRVVDEIGGRCH